MKPTTYLTIVLLCIFMVCFTSYNIIYRVTVSKSTIQYSVALKQSKPQYSTGVLKKCYFYPGIDGEQNLLF